MQLKQIATVHNGFATKFGVPRQSGLVEEARARIVFEREYRVPEALRGIEDFSHLWILWGFHQAERTDWSPTVRPPRLGGNVRKGVFATRSPFRPNALGLSCVRLLAVESTAEGPVLVIAGADMVDGTPVYDIKPYIPYADAHPEARGGFTEQVSREGIPVLDPENQLEKLPEETARAVRALLSQDPRPGYQKDPERVYGFPYDGWEIRFRVGEKGAEVVEVQGKGEPGA